MEQTLAALEAVVLVETLRTSRWLYAALNAAHIAAIGLLFGATVPLALRFLGLWSRIPREAVARVLVPMATLGFVLPAQRGNHVGPTPISRYLVAEAVGRDERCRSAPKPVPRLAVAFADERAQVSKRRKNRGLVAALVIDRPTA